MALILSFDEDLDREFVQEYIDYLKAKSQLGNLGNVEIKTLCNMLIFEPSFITLSNVNLIVTHYTRNNKHEKAIESLDKWMEMLDKKDRVIILQRVKQAIEENMKKRETIVGKKMKESIKSNRGAGSKKAKIPPKQFRDEAR